MTTPQDRFWSKVRVGCGMYDCWEWQSYRNPAGYGRTYWQGRNWLTHRLTYVWANGPESLPEDLCVLHHCDNPRCVKPEHLFTGTRGDNMADCVAKGRIAIGERVYTAKLSPQKVQEIRALLAAGQSARSIARQFGVDAVQVHHIKHGREWGHVPVEPGWTVPSGNPYRSKLTAAQIPVIRRLLNAGRSARSLAKQFGVSKFAMLAIKRGKTWAHVPMEAVS